MSDSYRFGPYTLDPQRRSVFRDGSPITVTPKAFDILLYLVQHPNRVVSKQDLMKAVWPDTIVEEGNLTQNISLLRKALDEHGADRLIVTVARQGYQFTADVTTDVPAMNRPAPWRSIAMFGGVALLILIGASMAWRRFRIAPDADGLTRLAVLPFENLTGDPAQDYLADGLTEELITQLARLEPARLGVIARTSVMRYKHSEKRMDEIGRDLAVRFALESSVRRSADRLRVTVQLIRVQDQSHIWANDFDYATQDILRVEDEVAAAVAREVQVRVAPVTRDARARTINPAAVDPLLRGRDILRNWRGGRDDWEHARRYFEQAIALDSSYALAWVWTSEVDRIAADRGFMTVEDGDREARQAAQRAIALDPNLPEAYGQLGKIQDLIDWDWTASGASYAHELALDPGSSDATISDGVMAMHLGHFDEAIALAKRAEQLDPLDTGPFGLLGETLYKAGRLDESASLFEKDSAAERSAVLEATLVQVYLAQDRERDARALADRITSRPWQGFARALVYVRQGRRHTADSLLTDYVAQYGKFAAYQIAEIYAYRNEQDSAFAWLDRASTQRDQGLNDTKVDPLLVNLHGDPRYSAFLTKMQLPH